VTPLLPTEVEALRLTIGSRCRRARERLKLSQRGIAKIMERSPSWVREIEGGEQYAPPYYLKALAVAIGETVGWFYGEGDVHGDHGGRVGVLLEGGALPTVQQDPAT
jgi:transcriptional regulator with XRE-family HTH domain